MNKRTLRQKLYWGYLNDWSSCYLSVFCLSTGLPIASSRQIWQSLFYLALCFFFRVEVCDSSQYSLDFSLLQSLYKYLLLCFQDPHQGRCLVWLIFLLCFCDYIARLSSLFLKINYLFFQFMVNIFYNHYIALEFLILCHNLIHAFCTSFNLFTEFM